MLCAFYPAPKTRRIASERLCLSPGVMDFQKNVMSSTDCYDSWLLRYIFTILQSSAYQTASALVHYHTLTSLWRSLWFIALKVNHWTLRDYLNQAVSLLNVTKTSESWESCDYDGTSSRSIHSKWSQFVLLSPGTSDRWWLVSLKIEVILESGVQCTDHGVCDPAP